MNTDTLIGKFREKHEALGPDDIEGKKKFILMGAKCAQLVIHLIKDDRTKSAIHAAISFGTGGSDEQSLEDAFLLAARADDENFLSNWKKGETKIGVVVCRPGTFHVPWSVLQTQYGANFVNSSKRNDERHLTGQMEAIFNGFYPE
jgi:hypothetical protein